MPEFWFFASVTFITFIKLIRCVWEWECWCKSAERSAGKTFNHPMNKWASENYIWDVSFEDKSALFNQAQPTQPTVKIFWAIFEI